MLFVPILLRGMRNSRRFFGQNDTVRHVIVGSIGWVAHLPPRKTLRALVLMICKSLFIRIMSGFRGCFCAALAPSNR